MTYGPGAYKFLGLGVTPVENPQAYYFDNLTMEAPEPASLAFVLPGLALRLRMRRHRAKNSAVTARRCPEVVGAIRQAPAKK